MDLLPKGPAVTVTMHLLNNDHLVCIGSNLMEGNFNIYYINFTVVIMQHFKKNILRVDILSSPIYIRYITKQMEVIQ